MTRPVQNYTKTMQTTIDRETKSDDSINELLDEIRRRKIRTEVVGKKFISLVRNYYYTHVLTEGEALPRNSKRTTDSTL